MAEKEASSKSGIQVSAVLSGEGTQPSNACSTEVGDMKCPLCEHRPEPEREGARPMPFWSPDVVQT